MRFAREKSKINRNAQMDFNVNKCAVLWITTKRKPSTFTYTMNGKTSPERTITTT